MKKHRNEIVLLALAVLILFGWLLLRMGGGAEAGSSPLLPAEDSEDVSMFAPATRGSGDGALPDEFKMLQTSNVFSGKGGHGPGAPGGMEANFVFKGVMQTGDSFIAFVEDVNAKNVMNVAAGGSIARGKIKAIDLDAIQYEVAGQEKRIEVGQDLNGQLPPPPAPTSVPVAGPEGASQLPPGPPGKGRHSKGGPPPTPGPQNGPDANPAQPSDAPPGPQ